MKTPPARGFFRRHFDICIVVMVIAGFVAVAFQRLAAAPVPETDEAYILQVAYELVNHGQLSWPMYRYLGGNIENVWHTFTPFYFLLLGSFFKLAGWGLAAGRAFHLLFSALLLLMVFIAGRRMSGWRAGLAAVLLLIGDQTFFERSRLVRYDLVAALFAMLAFYLYERAEAERRARYYIASGLAAGLGVMCHPNVLYMLAAISLLMLMRNGLRVIRDKRFYQFTIPALAVMSYVIIYDLIDYQNFALQNREDKLHFRVFQGWGLTRNLIDEKRSYQAWLGGGDMFLNVPRTTLHVFQFLAVASVVYLIVYSAVQIRRGNASVKPGVRLLAVIAAAILFHALIVSHKGIYYVVHISTWLAVSVGVMLDAGLKWLERKSERDPARAAGLKRATYVAVAIMAIAFSVQTARQYRRYLREVRNPQLARFDEIKDALRGAVPDGVCPIAVKSPVMWLAFPEHDRCFASIENRMRDALDLEGNEYAVLVPDPYDQARRSWTEEFDRKYPLIAMLRETAYGTINIYYTGTRPEYRGLPTKRAFFLGDRRGHVTGEQLESAREIWSASGEQLSHETAAPNMLQDGSMVISPASQADPIVLTSVDVKPGATYEFQIEATSIKKEWQVLVLDDRGEAVLQRVLIDPSRTRFEGLFVAGGARVRLAVQYFGGGDTNPLRVARIRLREIGSG
ncbi:MAG TPA: glycosyltransferase family 39 protein [Blastocatellia bacterium]|nr:glycosyltransferase family 39 protein [Blastocatellia bacterium]